MYLKFYLDLGLTNVSTLDGLWTPNQIFLGIQILYYLQMRSLSLSLTHSFFVLVDLYIVLLAAD